MRAEVVPLAEIDDQRRVLAMSQALIRLHRFDEAVRALNRLLSKPVNEAFFIEAKQTAQSALLGAGRTGHSGSARKVGLNVFHSCFRDA